MALLANVIVGDAAFPLLWATGSRGWWLAAGALLLAVLVGRLPRPAWPAVAGALVVASTAWVGRQTVEFPLLALLTLALGTGIGLSRPRVLGPPRGTTARVLAVLVAGAAIAGVLAIKAIAGVGAALAAGAALAVPAPVVALATSRSARAERDDRGGRAIAAGALAVLVVLSVTAWIGANSASATWFGALVSHGPRDRREVAITFDDGPNATATLAVSRILDRFGAKGTFFEVGKAVVLRPDITRALVRDGQVVANHSYHHDYLRWLDPRYPELGRDQQAIDRAAGVCPTFFRPPHGQHTPFMAYEVGTHHMRMVTWDVSTPDWATTDASRVARRVLAKVRPGSIIDLHDGLDGKVGADRSVVVRALPAIMEGLARKGLRVVPLDQMLGEQPYTGACS